MNGGRFVRPLLAAALGAALLGCGGGRSVAPAGAPPAPSRALEREVVEAVRAANDLERQLWDRPDAFTSREQVYDHYRLGFADDIAALLTTYSWAEEVGAVRPGDRSMAVPEEVRVLAATDREATVAYPNADFLRATWGLPAYTVARLRREAGRWVIVETTPAEQVPEQ